MVDSGATHNFVSKEFLNTLGGSKPVEYQSGALDVTLADGSLVQSTNAVCFELTFASYDGAKETHKTEFRVVPTLNHSIILGMAWLKEQNPTIHFKSGQVVFSNGVEVISGSSPESPVEVCSLKQFLKYCKNGVRDAWLCLMRSKNVSGNLLGLSASLANASSE